MPSLILLKIPLFHLEIDTKRKTTDDEHEDEAEADNLMADEHDDDDDFANIVFPLQSVWFWAATV